MEVDVTEAVSTPVPNTQTVIEDGRPKRKWSPEYKAKYAAIRKERYQNDPEYRERIRDRSKQYYHKKNPDSRVSREEVVANIAAAERDMPVRKVYVELADVGEEACVTEVEMANIIGRHPQSIQRMILTGRWPKPIFSTRNGRTKTGVFLKDAALAMARAYQEHLATSANYYETHTETRDKIFAAARAEMEKTELGRWALKQATEMADGVDPMRADLRKK